MPHVHESFTCNFQVSTYLMLTYIYTDYNLKIILSGHSEEAALANYTAQKQSSAYNVDMLNHFVG